MKKTISLLICFISAAKVLAQVAHPKSLQEHAIIIFGKSELLAQTSTAVCECLEKNRSKTENLKLCLSEEIRKNESSIAADYQGSELKRYTDYVAEVTFSILDKCELAGKILFNGLGAGYKPMTGGCKDIVSGNYSYDVYGSQHALFTDTVYKEFDDGGTLKEEYKLSWDGCKAQLTYEGKSTAFLKEGDTVTLEIKRASDDGFLGLMAIGDSESLVEYRKTK